MAKQKKIFKRIVKWSEGSDLFKKTFGYWIFYGFMILPFWIYNLYKYEDNSILFAYIPFLIYALIMVFSTMEVIYEEL